ncbi:hypothetical protein M404DRAFT_320186 [Pisolithus tinctorius Marx 270]|uniref:Uncharacterized protein n=1 Tax=Pisolithus tinctorius Marx 270 TaxID=870435 RepID=A0A0C3JCH3_PISTI|nr:hypothetical protein M404DRAFT_320186 [Pisolithus tinctorius Marx 270]
MGSEENFSQPVCSTAVVSYLHTRGRFISHGSCLGMKPVTHIRVLRILICRAWAIRSFCIHETVSILLGTSPGCTSGPSACIIRTK